MENGISDFAGALRPATENICPSGLAGLSRSSLGISASPAKTKPPCASDDRDGCCPGHCQWRQRPAQRQQRSLGQRSARPRLKSELPRQIRPLPQVSAPAVQRTLRQPQRHHQPGKAGQRPMAARGCGQLVLFRAPSAVAAVLPVRSCRPVPCVSMSQVQHLLGAACRMIELLFEDRRASTSAPTASTVSPAMTLHREAEKQHRQLRRGLAQKAQQKVRQQGGDQQAVRRSVPRSAKCRPRPAAAPAPRCPAAKSRPAAGRRSWRPLRAAGSDACRSAGRSA